MPLVDHQYQLRGLVMGPGTPFLVQEGTNPFSMSVRAGQTGDRAWSHGRWSGAEFADERVIPLRIHAEADSGDEFGAMQLLQQFSAAFRPVGEAGQDVELRFAHGGAAYIMFGRPRSTEPDIATLTQGQFYVSAAFVALDPFIYSADEQTATLGLPLFSGGLAVPFTVPFTIPGRLSEGIAEITNDGTADTSLLLRIDGPVVQPRVVLQRNDGVVQTLILEIVLQDGQWLDIDTGSHTVLLNGVANRRAAAIGTFPTLPPGTSTLRLFAAEHTDDAELTATWRHTFW